MVSWGVVLPALEGKVGDGGRLFLLSQAKLRTGRLLFQRRLQKLPLLEPPQTIASPPRAVLKLGRRFRPSVSFGKLEPHRMALQKRALLRQSCPRDCLAFPGRLLRRRSRETHKVSAVESQSSSDPGNELRGFKQDSECLESLSLSLKALMSDQNASCGQSDCIRIRVLGHGSLCQDDMLDFEDVTGSPCR